jgi:hypothetical protein
MCKLTDIKPRMEIWLFPSGDVKKSPVNRIVTALHSNASGEYAELHPYGDTVALSNVFLTRGDALRHSAIVLREQARETINLATARIQESLEAPIVPAVLADAA